MVFLEISNGKNNTKQLINELNNQLSKPNSENFVLIYMEGCGPCNMTRPEWKKMKNILSNSFLKRNDITIASIDKDLFGDIKNGGKEPMGFPTIRFIKNGGKKVEDYEDSGIENKDRSIDSFIGWVKHKTGEDNITEIERKGGGTTKRNYKKKNRKTLKKHKWSLKYKRSINCKKPKGFSQKQYCKYGRRSKRL